jgi:hypothetical protein
LKEFEPSSLRDGAHQLCAPGVPLNEDGLRCPWAGFGKALILLAYHGAQGRNRTTDTVIFSHVLYQLSYLGAGSARAGPISKARAL